MFRVVTDKLEVCPRNGALGRRVIPNDELLRDAASKCPERFSRNEACNAMPESFRDAGVGGGGGKWPDVGEVSLGEGGEAVALDPELVPGRS